MPGIGENAVVADHDRRGQHVADVAAEAELAVVPVTRPARTRARACVASGSTASSDAIGCYVHLLVRHVLLENR